MTFGLANSRSSPASTFPASPCSRGSTGGFVDREEEVGLASVREGAAFIRACIGGEPFDMPALIASLQELYETVRPGPSTAAIVEESRRRGIPVRRLNSRSLVQLGHGRNLRRIQPARPRSPS